MTRRLMVAAVVGLVLLSAIGSAAFAYFTTTGTGSGAGSGSAPAAVTVVASTATPSSLLAPGGMADLTLKFNNPNPSAVTLIGLAQNGTVTPVGGTGPGTACSTANTGVSVPTRTGLSVAVAAGSNVSVTVANGASMNTSSASGCQGASFQIPVTVTLQQ